MNFKKLIRRRTLFMLLILAICCSALLYIGDRNRAKTTVCASINDHNVPIMETIQENNNYFIVLKDLGNIKLTCSKSQYDYIDNKDKVYYIQYETDLFSKTEGRIIRISDKDFMTTAR